jgi:hypothetical protein
MLMGCFYGPYIYVVLPLGGLYLAADGLLLHAVRGGGHDRLEQGWATLSGTSVLWRFRKLFRQILVTF